MNDNTDESEDIDLSFEIPADSDISIEEDKLVIADEEYSLSAVKSGLEQRAKQSAGATVSLSSGGTTIGAVALGPPGALAGAVIGGSVGYLIDEGYLSFGSKEEVEEVEIKEVIEDGESISEGSDDSIDEDELPDIFKNHREHWYRPESEIYVLTVRTQDGGRAYFETVDGAKTRLEEEYGA